MKNHSAKYLEQPFEYLKRKNGEAFDSEIVANWYKARAFVLNKFSHIAFLPGDVHHFHPIVMVDNECGLMLSVVRQLALYAHFLNYNENFPDIKGRKRTSITIISNNPNILDIIQKEEYLCNLPKYCSLTIEDKEPRNKDSYIDIEIEIVKTCPSISGDFEYLITPDEVKAFCDSHDSQQIFSIDTRRAIWTQRLYYVGSEIDNLPYEDIHDVERYSLALNIFQYREIRRGITPLIPKEVKYNTNVIKESLSNIFCSDCFETRYKAIEQYYSKSNTKIDNWKTFNSALCMSEHARWVSEKLIMGYRPLNEQERLTDDCLFGEEKTQYRKQLKSKVKDPAHIDICSLSDLLRIDPDNLKYDSFLMLSIPTIIKNERA
ncbi:MAG: hypothetical protein J5671_02720 [Bacteroidaceae bacterium]|nr:hypothetical protein [Bacteroidaceae bacterium]